MTGIEEFFSGKNVLVTGVTGFLGKVLIEKLLRSCESIGDVHVLVRAKKDGENHPEARFTKVINHSAFDGLRAAQPKQLNKIKFICGDIGAENLGISKSDRNILINEVDVVFHCAALLAFNLSLLEISKVNVAGTHRLLELALEMKRLKSFTYVSTAYSQLYQTHVEEKHYPTGLDLRAVLTSINTNDSKSIGNLEKTLFKENHYNAYTMSKAIAEDLVYSYRDKFLVAVVRPSIIVSCNKEPSAGYLEGKQGANGVIASGMTGLNRFLWIKKKTKIGLIPADFAVNTIIAAAYKTSTETRDVFFNSTASMSNPLTYGEHTSLCDKFAKDFPPFEKLFWYPQIYAVENFFLYALLFGLVQLIPALVLDACRKMCGKKPWLTKYQLIMFKLMLATRRVTANNYEFSISNTSKLFEGLTEADQKNFMFDVDKIDWTSQVRNDVRGVRKHLLGEKDETIEKAQEKIKRLFWVDLFTKAACEAGIMYCCLNLIG